MILRPLKPLQSVPVALPLVLTILMGELVAPLESTYHLATISPMAAGAVMVRQDRIVAAVVAAGLAGPERLEQERLAALAVLGLPQERLLLLMLLVMVAQALAVLVLALLDRLLVVPAAVVVLVQTAPLHGSVVLLLKEAVVAARAELGATQVENLG